MSSVIKKQPIVFIAIGPSGSGKSTAFAKLKETNPGLEHFSWDALRHKWYDINDYANAFKLACEDKTFKVEADKVYFELLKTKSDIYIDNTNLSVKRRRPYIQSAKRLGYKTVAIMFDVPLETLIARQSTRSDKYVPDSAVTQHFNSLQPPTLEEFDEIIDSNEIK
jgi:predicted kinase